MSFESVGTAALVCYLLGLFGIAELARRARRDGSTADHVLASRDLGLFVLFLTLYATAYSGNSLLGYPGEAYRRGFSWIMAPGFMLAIIIVFHVLVPKLRPLATRHGFVTPGDWIRHRFAGDTWSNGLRIAIAVLMALAMANFLFAQLKAMGEMAEQVTGGLVPYPLGVFGLAVAVLFYETRGGLRAVAWTDAAQGVLMFVGLFALLGWLLGGGGGLTEMTRGVMQVRPSAAAVPDADGCANWLSTVLLLGLASVVYPQAIQRIYAARSGRELRGALALMSFMPLVTTLIVTLIGLAAIPRFPGLEQLEADRVMPRLLSDWAATGPVAMFAAVLVFIGALAAIMSTADSILLSFGSVVCSDVLGRTDTDEATARLGKRIAIGLMLAMALLALRRDITLWALIELKLELLIQCVPAFLIAIHWPRLRAPAVLVGLAVGSVIASAGVLAPDAVVWGIPMPQRIAGFHVGVLSLLVNASIAVGGSLALGHAVAASPQGVTAAS